jgi:hypothetical protein
MDEETKRRVDEMWNQLGIRLEGRRSGGTTERLAPSSARGRTDATPRSPER